MRFTTGARNCGLGSQECKQLHPLVDLPKEVRYHFFFVGDQAQLFGRGFGAQEVRLHQHSEEEADAQ